MRYRISLHCCSSSYLKKHGDVPYEQWRTGATREIAERMAYDYAQDMPVGCTVLYDTVTGERVYFDAPDSGDEKWEDTL